MQKRPELDQDFYSINEAMEILGIVSRVTLRQRLRSVDPPIQTQRSPTDLRFKFITREDLQRILDSGPVMESTPRHVPEAKSHRSHEPRNRAYYDQKRSDLVAASAVGDLQTVAM